jgi:hypothetical protein
MRTANDAAAARPKSEEPARDTSAGLLARFSRREARHLEAL